ncbi:MAG: metalloregulator ArsR/SmtB family transcription factor [Polyangiaceae bacterium]|nr:metalloregulator ArsR/SmtB family transcription factor [Polyangiaceae bacterium]
MESIDHTVSLLNVFGDATRVRLLSLLQGDELSVAELTQITELPQSRVSTHLGRLREAGLLRDRRDGTSTYYALNGAMPGSARQVWELLRGQVSDRVLDADRRRSEQLRELRRGASWPDSIAGEMERHYSPGRTWEATARGLLGFLRLGDVLDVGSGDGAIAELLLARCRTMTCLDKSERLIAAARRRFSDREHVRCVVGDMAELPFDAEAFDEVLCSNALTYVPHPAAVLRELARVLRPTGRLVVVTLDAHQSLDVTQAYGHVHPGFAPDTIAGWCAAAGLLVCHSAVTSRERKKPYFQVVTAFAEKPGAPAGSPAARNGKRT